MDRNYRHLYFKYKNKYLKLKEISQQLGGAKKLKSIQPTQRSDSSMSSQFYSEHLSEPWFTLISMGLKTVEGRKNKGRFKEMKIGDIVEWNNDDFKHRSVKTRIIGKNNYKTFEEYLNTEGLQKCLPGIPSIEHGLSVYFKYFTKEDEAQFGVTAIQLELIK